MVTEILHHFVYDFHPKSIITILTHESREVPSFWVTPVSPNLCII
jgi:hypothetical protein